MQNEEQGGFKESSLNSKPQIKPQNQEESLKAKVQQGLRKKKQLSLKASETGLSISQLKKLERRQKWEEEKIIKRKEKRQKQRQRKKEKKEKQLQINANHQMVKNQQEKCQKFIRKRKDQYQEKMQDNLKVVIDLQFYDEMTQKELNSLVKQLSYCHAINRKMQKPFHYILTSVTEQRLKFLDEKYNAKKWGIQILQQNLTKSFKPQNLVYLTGDAESEIEDFDDNKIYVIGGIVDHNRLKNITYNFAKQHQIQVKRLPFNNIKLKTNVHLAVNHVWEWMLRKYNGETWDQSLQKVLPGRKIQKINSQI